MPPGPAGHRRRPAIGTTSAATRYYRSSAINGGERIVENRRGRRFVNLCGF
ncbi:hypothetical protein [Bradyrhizobium australiense]|uniref:hypothetical protein n=1 Tax=Bradyrhizobium australiense TaxID=2721161 RepID=UPI001F250EA3|nr:hypothetical protein [Bradyrhizobium australiense]